MFTQTDFNSLSEVFAAARMQVATTQPQNREGMAQLLNFESDLLQKIEVYKEDAKEEPETPNAEPEAAQEPQSDGQA